MKRYLRLRAHSWPLALRLAFAFGALFMAVIPMTTSAKGFAYLPGATSQTTNKDEMAATCLSWQLPSGLLVADLAAPGKAHRFGQPFAPVYPASEWYLVREKPPRQPRQDLREILAGFGTIHLEDSGAFLVEIPADRLADFAALACPRQWICLDRPLLPLKAQSAPHTETPLTVQVDSLLKAEFIATIIDTAFTNRIREISSNMEFWYDGAYHDIDTRHYNTADKVLVGGYLGLLLESYGYTVEYQPFTYLSTTCHNIIATKTGTVAPDEIVVVGGHYDSTSEDPENRAPGAEDNASGTCLTMELARISAGRTFERTVKFVLFDAEEMGLRGSQHFVNEAVAAGDDIVAAIIADMVTWYRYNYAVIIEGGNDWEWLMSLMESNVADFTGLASRKDYFSWGSDHVPFQQAGIPAFLAIDWDWDTYPAYHNTHDVWPVIQSSSVIGVEIATACAATLADVAVLQPDLTFVGAAPPAPVAFLDAYPNPFNPRVTIAFELIRRAPCELALFDLRGRRLVTLTTGWLDPGPHQEIWNGTDVRGRALASGVYLCRLRTPDAVRAVKLNLAR
jgi:hypothetical protein